MQMTQRSAVLYLTKGWRPVHTLRFQRLRRQVAGLADCYVLYQSATGAVPDALRYACDGAVHVFRVCELPNRLGYDYLTPAGVVPGSAHYPLIDFYKSHAYRHYWLIEDDVEFSGNWAMLLRACADTEAGLLASHVMRHPDAPDWVWWGSMRAAFPWNLAMRSRVGKLCKAFLPICRLSWDALHTVDRLHRRGWTGHCEVLMPTAIANAGLQIVDLNTIAPLYRGTAQDPVVDVARQSTLRWRPEVSLTEFVQTFTPDTIYHPVKGDWTFDGSKVVATQDDCVDQAQPAVGVTSLL